MFCRRFSWIDLLSARSSPWWFTALIMKMAANGKTNLGNERWSIYPLCDTLNLFHLYRFLHMLNTHMLILSSDHQAHDALCEYVQVPCVHSECGELVSRANLAEHLEQTCQYRTEKCEYCKATVTFAVMKVTVVDAGLRPRFKQFLIEGRVVSLTCTACFQHWYS